MRTHCIYKSQVPLQNGMPRDLLNAYTSDNCNCRYGLWPKHKTSDEWKTMIKAQSMCLLLWISSLFFFLLSQRAFIKAGRAENLFKWLTFLQSVVSHGAVRSTASSYAAIRMVAGSRPVLIIAWEWHIGLALLCGCSGALEYPTTN